MSKFPLPIYPSLLDAWAYMEEAENSEDWEQRRSQFLDNVNRVKREPTEAMSRGTTLNNAVDEELHRRMFGTSKADDLATISPTVSAIADGKRFVFERSLVDDIVERLGDAAVQQVFSSCELDTQHGKVLLYGFADYVNFDTVTDLKCSTSYTVGKYANKWQRRVYPVTLVGSGLLDGVYSFEYLCAEVKVKDGVVSGHLCPETYKIDVKTCIDEIVNLLDAAVWPYLLEHKDEITEKKILAAL